MASYEGLQKVVEDRRGAFTRDEALHAGFTDRRIRTELSAGTWVMLGEAVYASRAAVEQLDSADERNVLVAEGHALASGDAVISHGSAVRWHRLPHLDGIGGRVQLSWPRDTHSTPWLRGPVNVRCSTIPATHVISVGGVRVTTVPRTVGDVARDFSFYDGVSVGDGALATSLTTRAEIEDLLVAMSGWPGVRQARNVIACLDARAANPLESIVHAMWWKAGLPRPELQVWMYDARGFIGIADGAWLDPVAIYETDGTIKYTELARPGTLLDEKRRQERIEDTGAIVRRFAWDDAFGRRKHSVDRMARALERARLRPAPRLRLYVGERDVPAPCKEAIRAGLRDPADIGLTLAYDGLR